MKPVHAIRLGILGVAAVLAVNFGVLYFHGDEAQQKTVSLADIGGPFRLASSSGGVVNSKDLKGKLYGEFFGFTHCPEVCPATPYEITKALTAIGDRGKDFRLFFITVDPERDTAAMLKGYLSNFDPRIEALVPTPGELTKVAKEFRAIYEKVPGSDGEHTMNHTATVYLLNREGKLADTISYDETPANRIAKIRNLMTEGQSNLGARFHWLKRLSKTAGRSKWATTIIMLDCLQTERI